MRKSDKIFVAGHRGLAGSALVRRLESEGFDNLAKRDRSQLDLADEGAVQNCFERGSTWPVAQALPDIRFIRC